MPLPKRPKFLGALTRRKSILASATFVAPCFVRKKLPIEGRVAWFSIWTEDTWKGQKSMISGVQGSQVVV